jgi:protein-disulfide isomerase
MMSKILKMKSFSCSVLKFIFSCKPESCDSGDSNCKYSKYSKKVLRFVIQILLITLAVNATNYITNMSNFVQRKYMMNNAQDIIKSVQSMYEKEKKGAQEKAKEKAKEVAMKMKDDNASPTYGNVNAKNTIVEFFDYNCGYCKRGNGVIDSVISKRDDVKVISVNLPILGEDSVVASRASIAFYKISPKNFHKFHSGLMSMKSPMTKAKIFDLSTSFGVSKSQLEDRMKSKDVEKEIEENYKTASQMSLTGTPAYIVNGTLFGGMVSEEEILSKLDK